MERHAQYEIEAKVKFGDNFIVLGIIASLLFLKEVLNQKQKYITKVDNSYYRIVLILC